MGFEAGSMYRWLFCDYYVLGGENQAGCLLKVPSSSSRFLDTCYKFRFGWVQCPIVDIVAGVFSTQLNI